jgi:hypothetical protein
MATKARTNLGTHLPEPHPRPTQAHAAQGSVILGPEQGELGANFSHLGSLSALQLASFLLAS